MNLLLTLLTLGIYSAWAKVRKTRYFFQNTQFDGHAFDYHGAPRAILLGRIIALLLLAGYTFAFDISRTAGFVMVFVLCAAGPWLFMRAQRFRFANTSWRGLRFGFDTKSGEAYRTVLPALLIWFSSAFLAALMGLTADFGQAIGTGVFVAVSIVTVALIPWIHHRLKAYQHERARYGSEAFTFIPSTRAFYALYGKVALLVFGTGMVLAATGVSTIALVTSDDREAAGRIVTVLLGVAVLITYLAAWPYFAARMQALVWSRTRLRDVRFHSTIEALPLVRLAIRNVLLVVVTAGFYWPFAAIAFARYRVECMHVDTDVPLSSLVASAHAAPGAAAGDAAVDAFGLDIGL